MKKSVQITDQLVAKALGLKMETWQSLTRQAIKQKGILIVDDKEHIKYSDLSDPDLDRQLQMLDLLATVAFPDHTNRVTTTTLTCVIEQRLAFSYISNQVMESVKKTTPILANP